MKYLKFIWELLKETFNEWNNSSASKDSASIAYYAIFSLPGLLIIVIWIAGIFFGDEAIRGEITRQASGIAGKDIADSIQTVSYTHLDVYKRQSVASSRDFTSTNPSIKFFVETNFITIGFGVISA